MDLSKKDVRRSVPKGLPYFSVDFGNEGGFAHVIEEEKTFPTNFAQVRLRASSSQEIEMIIPSFQLYLIFLPLRKLLEVC